MRLKRDADGKRKDGKRRAPAGRRLHERLPLNGLRRYLPRLILIGVLGGVAGWLWQSGSLQRAAEWTVASYYGTTAEWGLAVNEVMVEGREKTERELVLEQLEVRRGAPILAFNPQEARRRLEELPWVERAEVERRLPDHIFIRLHERDAMALWQKDRKLQLIDGQGQVISGVTAKGHSHLPLVVGPGAAEHATEILGVLRSAPVLAEQVEALVRVSERRWNVKLENGVEIQLPETGAAEAWHQLARVEREQGLFARDVEIVDLRLPDRLIIRTLSGERPPGPQQAKGTDT